MAYTQEDWIERSRNRTDISNFLYHLTRDNDEYDYMEVLIKILNERKLIGSTTASGFIVGDDRAVCFQDTTAYGLAQNSFHEHKLRRKSKSMKVRYLSIGLAFNKKYIYDKGGRPVIYEDTEVAKNMLPKDERLRIVNFNLGDSNKIIDWTHEREWRVKGDFEFDLKQTYVILTNSEVYTMFVNEVADNILKSLGGIVVLEPVLT